MSKLVIVAIPEQDDYVWQISSEKVPHITLLFLGDADANQNSEEIVAFVEHAATTISPFYMDAGHRGTLGEDDADVIFFEKGWDYKAVSAFRDQLLTNTHIKQAYNSTEQFPEWTPHLTLGYPATPAKTPDHSQRIHSVSFDRIGVWFGDYEGPEFRLERKVYETDAMSMSSMSAAEAKELLHYGKRGVKWDVSQEKTAPRDIVNTRQPSTIPQVKIDKDDKKIEKEVVGIKIGDSAPASEMALTQGEEFVEGLFHYGVKGMKWGQSRAPIGNGSVTVKTGTSKKGKAEVSTSGGSGAKAHKDAINAAKTRQVLKKSGTNALSNKELQDLSQRINLERQIGQLTKKPPSAPRRFVQTMLGDVAKQQIRVVANDQASKQVKNMMASAENRQKKAA